MITSRTQVTDMIQSAKILKGIKWSQIAEVVGQSKEWSTAACLGQMAMTKQQAEAVGELLELTDEAIAWLQIVPYKGSLPTEVPTDPLIYRWYELVSVYGTTLKELKDYKSDLVEKIKCVVLNKVDSIKSKNLEKIVKAFNSKGIEVLPISTFSRVGIDKLKDNLLELLKKNKLKEAKPKGSAEKWSPI